MTIKPDAERYFVGYEEERNLARHLDEAFDITFRDSRGELSFWLAEPKPHTKMRFGIQQEVLVICSLHKKTDARVLTAIENISRTPDFKHRVEKVISVLVHKGDQNETQDLLKKTVDRIVVPIQVDELLNPSRGNFFLRSRLAQAIGSVDLFGMTSAITSDRYFFGRDELVQRLIGRITIQKENSGIFGLRKTGKTSILRAIQRRTEDKDILTEYIDCQNPGIHAARWWQVLENIVCRCEQSLNRDFHKPCKLLKQYSESNAGTGFSSDIKAIISAGNLNQVVLMFDEIEFITHGLSGALGQHWDRDFLPFWQTIRSTHQETQGDFVFIVSGVNPACVETSHFGNIQNPIFQLALPHYLEPFSVSLVREMVRTIGKYAGLEFSEAVFAYLQSIYGGHPFLIRIACSQIWKKSSIQNPEEKTKIEIQDFEIMKPEIKAKLASPIKDILLSLVWWYPEEYELLRILATGDVKFVEEYIEQEPKSVFQFAQYGILRKESIGEFAIVDIKEFLNRYGEAYKKEISPFSRGDMPPELLPELPDLDKVGRLFEKRTEIEIKLRKAIMLYLNVKYTFDPQKISQAVLRAIKKRADRPDPKDLFIGRSPQDVMNQLYSPDLKDIIIINWDIFNPLFENKRERFEMNMDTLNIARRVDAHTKPVTPEEASDFENSYSWLLAKLAKIQ